MSRSMTNFNLLLSNAKGAGIVDEEIEEKFRTLLEDDNAVALRKLVKHVLDTALPIIRKKMAEMKEVPVPILGQYQLATNFSTKLGRRGYHVRANACLVALGYLEMHEKGIPFVLPVEA